MQLSPRYGTDPLITLDGPPDAILGPLVRQQARFVAELGKLDEDGWTERSRCDAWTNRDVIVHLDTATSFFAFAIRQGLAGEPTQFLATFDPVASPAQMVADAGAVSSEEVLAKFAASSAAMAELLGSLDDDDWTVLAEAPPGHVSVAAVAHHSLWDSWVHERDVFLPLGIVPDEEPDEITASLRYVAALSPAFAVHHGRAAARSARRRRRAARPDLRRGGDRSRGRGRRGPGRGAAPDRRRGPAPGGPEPPRPLDQTVPEGSAWMLEGLAETFDAVP